MSSFVQKKPVVCFCDDLTNRLAYTEDDFKSHLPKFQVITLQDIINNPELAERVQGVAATIYPPTVAITRKWIPQLPKLRAIVTQITGKDRIWTSYGDFGIPVAYTPDAYTDAVADHAMCLISASGCGLLTSLRSTIFTEKPRFLPPTTRHVGVHGTTLGIVGMGAIGRAVAKKASGFDMRILYRSRRRKPDAQELGATYEPSLDEMLPLCDYVVLCCDLNDSTRGLIGAAQLDLMKTSACLLNVSRGQVVDQEALIAALRSGGIREAALDVTYPEPLPPGHPLLALPNVILTPHSAAFTYRGLGRALDIVNENFEAALIYGRQMPHLVVPDGEIPDGGDGQREIRPGVGKEKEAECLDV